VVDPNCVNTTQVGSGTFTQCGSGVGSGYKLRVTTTTTTTTTQLSGTTAVNPPSIVSSTGAPVELTACLATTDPLVALPTINPHEPGPTESPSPPGGCGAWPCITSTTVPSGSQNSLADVAQYYYKTDLRSDDTNWPNIVKPLGAGDEDDKATHQHMTTFVVGLGVSGTLDYRADYRSTSELSGDFPKIRCVSPPLATAGLGCTTWPVWPDPAIAQDGNGNYANTDDYNNPKSIDDFWHTAVDGRGTFFSATDPTSVIAGIGGALSSIGVQTAAGAGDAASSFAPTAGNNFVFTSTYQTGGTSTSQVGWIGNVEAFTINVTTGALDTGRIWSARDLLDSKTKPQCDTRNIYLLQLGGEYTAGGGQNLVDFSWNTFSCDGTGAPTGAARTGLNATEKGFFGSSNVQLLNQYPAMTDGSAGTVDQRTPAAGANLVNVLRGQSAYEGFATNTNQLYRIRKSTTSNNVLGDIVGSQPVYVGVPFATYQDAGYGAFITANVSRTPMVYVGANDGMLHAFYAMSDAADTRRGQEAWAVIPQAVLPNLYRLADFYYNTNHRFFVDGSPVASDVYDGSAWHTILVGGLNAGGKSYYALDVTDPLAPKALWEFQASAGACGNLTASIGQSADCNLGLSFGKPVITKLAGTWVVMITSGYNNISSASNGGDGGGFLYVLNAMTGQIISKMATGAGNSSTPSGLAQINNFVENTFVDNTTVRAYGGDLMGNIFRFEFSPTSVQLIGVAKDDSGTVLQPITTRPEIAEVNNQPIIFVGTGSLLGSSDVTNTSQQSIYGILDPLTPGPVYASPDLRSALRPLKMTQQGTGAGATRTIACSGTTAECARTAGWVVDLSPTGVPSEVGERINVPMQLNFGTLVAASNVPEAASCTVGGHSWFNYLDFQTGLAVDGAALSDPGNPNSGHIVSQYISDSLVAGFSIYKLPPLTGQTNGRFVTQFHNTDASHPGGGLPPPTPLPQGKRISWREITQ
jgi:type IV pilus assembly protein PilY1